ncbi:MAG: AAA family ATPase [Planctomycetes bacterium]|jgi:hypothetical protein|nr:AAA family ATPase [Planctomycetota bacterium]
MTPFEGNGPSYVSHLLARLNGVRRRDSGWRANCPAHPDEHPSLDVDLGDDGRILLCCRSGGCEAQSIVAAIGLAFRDLYPTADAAAARRRQPATKRGRIFTREDAIKAATVGGQHGGSWIYLDKDGHDVLLVVRKDRANGKKDFRQLHREQGGWAFGAPEQPLPLYRLPSLLQSPTDRIFVVEGEKCVEALARLGCLATTSAGGARSPGRSDWSVLGSRVVTILTDNDDPGRAYGQKVASLIRASAPAADVGILELPGLPVHGDVVDWIEQRRRDGLDDASIAGQLCAMAVTRVSARTGESITAGEPVGDCEPVLTCLADVAPQEVDWLWRGRVPLGRLTMFAGNPGTGKSYVTAAIAAQVSLGGEFPDGAPCVRGDVLLISAEDDPADTIRPRLDGLGADPTRLLLLSMVRLRGKGGLEGRERMFSLQDIEQLEMAIRARPTCRLVVVDPVGSYLGKNIDSHRDSEVRSVLAPVAALAKKYHVAIIVVMHRRKGTADRADDLLLGSVGFAGIARSVWHVIKDPKNPARRLMLCGKQNLSAEGDGLAFRIENGGSVGRLVWESAPVRMSADEALWSEQTIRESKPGPAPERREEAELWLRDVLAAGPVDAKDVRELAAATDHSWRTVQRASGSVGVQRTKRFDGGWTWGLPAALESDRPRS